MLCQIKKWIMKIIGGVPRHEHQKVLRENEAKSAELDAHRRFVESIYYYSGNYPAWKAQQEFREYLHGLGLPLKTDYSTVYPAKKESIDIYLGNIVDAFVILKNEGYLRHGSGLYWNEELAKARGADYLAP